MFVLCVVCVFFVVGLFVGVFVVFVFGVGVCGVFLLSVMNGFVDIVMVSVWY